MLTYTRDFWPLGSEGSLASVYNGHLRDTHTYCRAFGSGAVTTRFNDQGLSRLGFEHSTFPLRSEREPNTPQSRLLLTVKT